MIEIIYGYNYWFDNKQSYEDNVSETRILVTPIFDSYHKLDSIGYCSKNIITHEYDGTNENCWQRNGDNNHYRLK